jgi:hypothetical protein
MIWTFLSQGSKSSDPTAVFQYALDPPVAAAGVEATTRQFSSDFIMMRHTHSERGIDR